MKIMVLGSGSDYIGKMGDTDRFAFQALRFLANEGHEIVWVDVNPVTMVSSSDIALRTYLEPLRLNQLERIIQKERPDSLTHGLGGYLAMHLAIFLDREGILDRYGVQVLGTPVPALKQIMDDEIFKKKLQNISVPVLKAAVAHNVDSCVRMGQSLGFPLALKPSFSREGIGSYIAYNVEEVEQFAHLALSMSPVQTVELEQVPVGCLQLALEGIHDPKAPGDVHLIGTLEALDTVEVHPGNSIVVAPSSTLEGPLLDRALHYARLVAEALEICGSFQIRFAFSASSEELIVKRVLHGLNRFSSLFSILYGLPLAEINVSLSLGLSPEEIKSRFPFEGWVSGKNGQSIVRLPAFSEELRGLDSINTTNCSAGANAFIGKNLDVALTKAVDFMSVSNLFGEMREERPDSSVEHFSAIPSLERLLRHILSLEHGEMSLEDLPPDGFNPNLFPYFKRRVTISRKLRAVGGSTVPAETLGEAKRSGFSDAGISQLAGTETKAIRKLRDRQGICPYLSALDGDRSARNLYSVSYEEADAKTDESAKNRNVLLLLGPGYYRIGWGPWVDQALVNTARALKDQGKGIVLLNNNPDAVSMDADIMDAICLEPTSLEAIGALFDQWSVGGVVHQFCLHLPEGLDELLAERGVRLLGTPYASLKRMESPLNLWHALSEIGVSLLPYELAHTPEDAIRYTETLGFPLLVRLTNTGLNPESEILYDIDMLRSFLYVRRGNISEATPLFMEILTEGMTGFELMALCDGQNAITLALTENVEEYGIHSGNCASIAPSLSIGELQKAYGEDALMRIVRHFGVVGHLSIGLAIKGRNVYVTSVKPYPSLNFPLAEKTMGLQASHKWAARLILGESLDTLDTQEPSKRSRYCVRESTFPFPRFPGMDPVLSPRMLSDGQVLGTDATYTKAYLKSQIAANPTMPFKGNVFISARDSDKQVIFQISRKLTDLGFSLVSTQGTAQFLADRGIKVDWIHKVSGCRPNVIDLIKNGDISLVINIPGGVRSKRDEKQIRRVTIENNIPLVTSASGAFLMVKGIEDCQKDPLALEPYQV